MMVLFYKNKTLALYLVNLVCILDNLNAEEVYYIYQKNCRKLYLYVQKKLC